MLTFPEKIIFLVAVIVSGYLSWISFGQMFRIIKRGQDKLYWNNLGKRLLDAFIIVFTQKTVLKTRPFASFLHALIAWAFILYFLVNLGDVLSAYIAHFHFMGRGLIGDIYRFFVDLFSVFALISVAYFLIRRFLVGSPSLNIRDNVKVHPAARQGMRTDSLIVGLFIFFHIGFRFIGESFLIQINGADIWQPLASLVAGAWTEIDGQTIVILFHISWWLALGLILAFIPYFPSSKHIHLFMAPLNYASQPERSSYGTMDALDFEADDVEQFGIANFSNLDQTQILDAYACIMCNRCQDACPAYATGKELSPAAYEVNKRYFIKEHACTLAKGETPEYTLLDFALSESALWACTSCAACVDICPVGNEPMFDILNIRRDRVLMESKFPKELQGAFNGMERNQNPWNINDDRLNWVKEDPELKVPTVEDNPDFEILYWVGCAGAFDQKGQEIARSFSKILNHAGVNFAVLGNNESCTGDSARRAGNEYLFSMMAEANVETLNGAKVKKIVATCPHCLHTLKNEYPQFGGTFEVLHHTELINDLQNENKLQLKPDQSSQKITYHDPCYLGRHNDVFEEPRANVKMLGMDFVELDRSGSNSFCCGAGGAQMWKEEENGSEPIRQNRMKEVQDSGAELVCTSCPFCLTMMRDASNELEAGIESKDIAQLIAERL